MLTRPELRARARESLSGNWKPAVLHYLLFVVITGMVGLVTESIDYVGWMISILIGGPFTYGIVNHYLDFARGTVSDVQGIFSGFQKFRDTLLLSLLLAVFTFLWMLLLIVPGIIAGLRYSQAYYILRDNPGMDPLEAINRSKAMMAGQKANLFVLGLSFIGWAVLCVFTCGIGTLWLCPYIYTTFGHFYEELRRTTGSESTVSLSKTPGNPTF